MSSVSCTFRATLGAVVSTCVRRSHARRPERPAVETRAALHADRPATPSPAAKAKSKPVDLEYQQLQSRPTPVYTPVQAPTAAPSTDVTSWPGPVLEHNAKALAKRLSTDPGSVSTEERALLGKIEAEMSRRDAAAAKAAKAPVLLGERPADLPGAVGLTHRWLKTPNKEAGMGPAAGSVPGKEDGPSGYPGVPTTINNHAGAGGPAVTCEPVDDVDADCVDRELESESRPGAGSPRSTTVTPRFKTSSTRARNLEPTRG